MLIGFSVIGAWKLRPGTSIASRWLAISAATTVIVLAPWSIRNYRQLGGIFFVRDDLGLELLVSNHTSAFPTSEANFQTGFFRRNHPHMSSEASREVRHYGELAFERRELRQALGWIRDNTRAFATLTVERAGTFWFPRVPRHRWAFAAVTLAAFASLGLLYRRAKLVFAVLGVILAGYSAIYYIVENTFRYQHPLWWIQVLLIGWVAHTLAFRRLALQSSRNTERQRGEFRHHARQG